MKSPRIVIIGRPNVGKSTLLNSLVKKRVSIVDGIPGTTLDSVTSSFVHEGYRLELTDTGGILDTKMLEGKSRKFGVFDKEMRLQILHAIKQADVLLFLMDIRDGITPLDKEIAKLVRPYHDHLILAINKADTASLENDAGEFYGLGLGEPILFSALQKRGLDTMRERIIEIIKSKGFVPDDGAKENEPLKVAIVGKRNVGKSTLVNNLAQMERMIVSEIPGTTRDSVDVRFEIDGEVFIAIDTAGLRRKAKPKDSVEVFSRMRTEFAMERADVILFLIDARERVSDVDKKIAETLVEGRKPCIIIINKWDLVPEGTTPDDYIDYLSRNLPSLKFAPISFISAKSGFNVKETIKTAQELIRQSKRKISTSLLNRYLDKIKNAYHPKAKAGKFPRMYYATQTGNLPLTITIFVNSRRLFDNEYLKFVTNHLRKDLKLENIPVQLVLRQRERDKKGARPSGHSEQRYRDCSSPKAFRGQGRRKHNDEQDA
ncbi:MAG: ribosome biogenesis GTPase Der [Planctomycetes bacterium]|nr:ribosome biogenesis GTPase Der [Planctomycetota bacterium]